MPASAADLKFRLAALAGTLMFSSPSLGQTVCSVFDEHPCTPTFCSVFDERPCRPELSYPFGDGLRLTIQDRERPQRQAPQRQSAKPLDTIQELFGALEACWIPPPLGQSRPGTEITIRFSLNRAGEIIGEPRFTYSTRDLPSEVKTAYQRAVAAMLSRCTPLPLSAGLGGAIAGRPISTRFIDDRGLRRQERRT
jgi:hypothetical protein